MQAGDPSALAKTLHKLGMLEAMTGRLDEGEQTLRIALELQRHLAAGPSAPAEVQQALALTETGLAGLLTTVGEFPEAEALYDDAVLRQERLATAAPGVPVYRLGLARSVRDRGRLRGVLGRPATPAADLRRAFELFRKLAEDHPHRPDYRLEMAGARHDIARVSIEKVAAAEYLHAVRVMEQSYRDAIAEQERLVAEFPAVVENHRRLATSLDTLATWVNDSAENPAFGGRPEPRVAEALALHRRSEAIWLRLAAEHPTVLEYQNGLAVSHQRHGVVLTDRVRDFEEAAWRYREALTIQEQFTRRYPHVDAFWIRTSALHNNLGVAADHQHDLAQAEARFRIAMGRIAAARAINPLNPTTRILSASHAENLGRLLARLGRHHEAAARLHEAACYWPQGWWNYSRFFERLGECVRLAQNDASLTPPRRAELVRQYEDWTLDLVRRMIAEMDLPAELPYALRDAHLDHVRHRAEFARLRPAK